MDEDEEDITCPEAKDLDPWTLGILKRRVLPQNWHAFLTPMLRHYMPDPAVLPDIAQGIEALNQAIDQKEILGLWGDYDVDGTTSTALWYTYFQSLGVQVIYHIPHRFQEGYGLNIPHMKKLYDRGVRTLLVLDSGTVAFEPLTWASQQGMKVVVMDHHMPENTLPPCAALINPKCNPDLDAQGLHDLAAVGVSFLVMVALNSARKSQGDTHVSSLMPWLDFVALGTVCDVMPLTHLNRIFVHQGLKFWGKRPGIAALCEVAQVPLPCVASDLSHRLGPYINAAGRMHHAREAVELFITSNQDTAYLQAHKLRQWNQERKEVEASLLEQALTQDQPQKHAFTWVALDEGHGGVVGIIASRMKDRYPHVPAFVVSWMHEDGKGSVRSVPGLNVGVFLHDMQNQGIIVNGGGHAMAGGFHVKKAKASCFMRAIGMWAEKGAKEAPPQTLRYVDGVMTLEHMTTNIQKNLQRLAPFGVANPYPRLYLRQVMITAVHCTPKWSQFRGQHYRRTFKVDAFPAVNGPLYHFARRNSWPMTCDFVVQYQPHTRRYFLEDVIITP